MSWRETQAAALDEQANELRTTLAAIGVAHDVLEQRRDEVGCTELRATASMLRSKVSTIQGEARELRPSSNGFPAALTAGPTTRRTPRHAGESPDLRRRDEDDDRSAV